MLQNIELLTMPETVDEKKYDYSPTTFQDYIGQIELKKKLSVYTQAARMRHEALDHLLLFGPPGLGKTTLAQIMAHELSVGIKICSGPMLERTGDLVAILSSLEQRDILFIDEIHRLPIAVEEVLYGAMEEFRVDVIIGQGAGAKSVNLPLHPFTLIGATTKSGKISAPLRSRFGITERLDFYTYEELTTITLQNAHYLHLALEDKAALLIAQAARGTPRIAKKILRRVRDFAQVHNNNVADEQLVIQALSFLGIDHEGLTKVDNAILEKMVLNFHGGPVGLETIASLIGEDSDTIETVYEPFLLRKGYLEKTSRGRQIPTSMMLKLQKRFSGQTAII